MYIFACILQAHLYERVVMFVILLALAALNAFFACIGESRVGRGFNAAIAVYCLGMAIIIAPDQ